MRDELKARLLLPPPGARVLCAVSGGADSMCLLALLCELGDWELAAAHVEHGIRGEESRRDCAFVEEYCRARGVACFVEHADAPRYAKEGGLCLEEAARELRYGFLERIAAERDFAYIATAHTADDNAETLLLNLARGAGLRGLGGIPPQRGKLIRPLLALTRAEIETLLRERGIPHVEDSSNGSEAYSRNRIRHAVVPVLRELNPHFEKSAARAARLLRRDEDCLDALAEAFIKEHYDGERIPARELLELHEAVSSRVVRKLLPRGAEEGHVDAVLALCRSPERGFADVPGLRVRCERGSVYFSDEACAEIPETELRPGESVFLEQAGLVIRTEIAGPDKEIHSAFKLYALKYESISGRLSVSSPRAGERYRPAGRGCTKTLKSLFAERKATQDKKKRTPVFRDERGIVLVPDFGEAAHCAAQPGDRLLIIEIRENE